MQAEIRVDLSQLAQAKQLAERGIDRYFLTETQEAIQAGTALIQSTWMNYVSGSTVAYSGGEFRIKMVSGDYMRAVQTGMRYPMDGDVLKGGVVVDLDYADTLERGFGPYDIKTGLLASPKAKRSESVDDEGNIVRGPLYIDVPFRHAEASLPKGIKAETFGGGRSLGVIRLGKGLGKAEYGLRTKLAPKSIGGQPYTWRTGLFAGLHQRPSGPEARNEYMTFRRVSENSDPDSWIHPGNDPKPVSKALEENLGDALKQMVSAAFERDVLRISRQMGLAEGDA